MPGLLRSSCLVGVGIALIGGAALMASTTDSQGHGPVARMVGIERPYLKVLSVDVAPSEVSLAWSGNASQYRVLLGDDLAKPARTIVTTEPMARLRVPQAADPRGRVNYRVESVQDGATELAVEGTVTLLPEVPPRPKVKRTAPEGAVVKWKPADYATTYDVAVSTSKKELPKKVKRLTQGGTAFATDSLKPERTYWVRVRAVGEAGVSRFSPPIKVTTPPAGSEFSIGSWNICSEACSGFGGRVGGQAAQVHASGVDILALQEAGGERVGPTTRAAFSGGPKNLVPAQGGGNSRYLFYSPEKFTQLGGGRWSLGHGRWATWARLEDTLTERPFIVVSVHLLSGHKKNGERASEMRSLMGALAGINTQDDPVVLAGDFNSGTHRSGDTVGPIVRSSGYSDTVEVADETQNAQVNTGSRRGDQAIMSHDHVDHIYASSDWKVPAWRQWANLSGTTYVGTWLSDHNMIAATVVLERDEKDAVTAPSEVVKVPAKARKDVAPGTVS
ncbi:endonuclease/exonuclease/phosphatase family protein [Aeromicrobium duanguangcaii]|uniref:endonuclease/exonuclease/phosphatase family protein n=1 Tax=Aeromicrobium duanguangcaii TaxID=2968086 RepID=UPI002017AAEE|nr:endonuclease/exonuclease/phosphatase family protein [Aeromicrobium duanguangcaii]MCL3837855.1 endonuclease/exonuclease/phosphatase family protein [Aeromicrobium duanguangcaii]